MNEVVARFATLQPALLLRDELNRAAALAGRQPVHGVVEVRGDAAPWRVVLIRSVGDVA